AAGWQRFMNSRRRRRRHAARAWDGSGIRDHRGALEGGDTALRRRMLLAGALEQHLPLASSRTHDREAGQYLFPDGPEIARHQCDLLLDDRNRTRPGDGLLQEHPAIKRLMLGTHEREPGISVEIFA